jgi:hypothetical protein
MTFDLLRADRFFRCARTIRDALLAETGLARLDQREAVVGILISFVVLAQFVQRRYL